MTCVELHEGDCLETLRTLPDNSVDSVVTDPPYHLTSIVKRFGGAKAAPAKVGQTGAFARASRGFMGQTWDGGDIAFRPELWAEVLRVLKPGGHLAAFSGTRTYHRMAVAIEDAGFEIRDQLAWTYGTGFPKVGLDEQGRGSALKPAWEPICLARRPCEGTALANIERYGTGKLHVDACRIDVEQGGRPLREVAPMRADVQYAGNALAGRVDGSLQSSKAIGSTDLGRFPANLLHDGSPEVLAGFPDSSGIGKARTLRRGERDGDTGWGMADLPGELRDAGSGSAARFFYCAKASKADREDGNNHPTVKPTDLMRWLCRLITPPGGVVLDPFTGSGSTGKAAVLEGFGFIGMELSAEYAAIARRRITGAGGVFAVPAVSEMTTDNAELEGIFG